MTFDFSTVNNRVDLLASLKAGNQRGKALEALVEQMLVAIPGITVADRNVLSGQGEAELDLLLTNKASEGGLEAFGRDILVECKSSDSPLNSAGVNHFATQLVQRKLRWSVIVSLAGLTGNEVDLRAAHIVIRDRAVEGHGILLVVERELRFIRSAGHFVNVLERKRQKMVARLRAEIFSDAELKELDPDKGIRRGLTGIESAIRTLREDAIALILERARELPTVDLEAALERADRTLQELANVVVSHKASPEHDPMWRDVHDQVVEVGAAFVTLFDEPLTDPDADRIIAFDINRTAPQNLDAHTGGELWDLLTTFYVRQAKTGDRHTRAKSASAVAALAVDEIIAINDMDPRDVYDNYEDHSA